MKRFHDSSSILRVSSSIIASLLGQPSSLRVLAVKMSTNNAPESSQPSARSTNGVYRPRYIDVRLSSPIQIYLSGATGCLSAEPMLMIMNTVDRYQPHRSGLHWQIPWHTKASKRSIWRSTAREGSRMYEADGDWLGPDRVKESHRIGKGTSFVPHTLHNATPDTQDAQVLMDVWIQQA